MDNALTENWLMGVAFGCLSLWSLLMAIYLYVTQPRRKRQEAWLYLNLCREHEAVQWLVGREYVHASSSSAPPPQMRIFPTTYVHDWCRLQGMLPSGRLRDEVTHILFEIAYVGSGKP